MKSGEKPPILLWVSLKAIGLIGIIVVLMLCFAGGFMLWNADPSSWEAEVQNQPCDNEIPELVSSDTTAVDISLLTEEPCEPPCWYGIVPGKSTIQDAMKVLQTASFVDQNNLELSRSTIYWQSQVLGYEGRVNTIPFSDIVGEIWYIPEYRLRIQDLIDIYGEPDRYSMDRGEEWQSPDCSEIPFGGDCHASTHCIDASFFWADQRLRVSIYTIDDRKLQIDDSPISPDILVRRVEYMVDNGIAPYLRPWPGFENIELPPMDD